MIDRETIAAAMRRQAEEAADEFDRKAPLGSIGREIFVTAYMTGAVGAVEWLAKRGINQ